ncbi:MAG: hypothetical protein ACRBN8_14835 [Nannocystales bacterium]
MSDVPSLRAAQIRENLAWVSEYGPELDALVRGGLGPRRVHQIEGAKRMAWLPVELDICLAELMYTHGGPELFELRSRNAMLATAKSPILHGFLEAGLRMLGTTPSGVAKLAPRGYSHMYRNAGAIEVEVYDDSVSIHGHDFPAMMTESHAYITGLGAAFSAIPEYVGYAGHYQLHQDSSELRWDLTWSKRVP